MLQERFTVERTALAPEKISRLCEKLSKLECRIYVEDENQRINAKSVMGMLSFQAQPGRQLQVSAEGKDEAAAVALLKGLFIE